MKKIYLVIVVVLFSLSVFGQNEKTKVVFIYNFTKYISWPAADNSGDFTIGVVSSPSMSTALKGYVASKKVGARSIKVVDFASAGAAQKCHIIYVPSSGNLGAVIGKFGSKSVLVVADAPGSIGSGAAINFVNAGGKQQFEIKKGNIEKSGLKVSDQLINMGIAK